MNPDAYARYSTESDSWLHNGRKELIRRILHWHAPKGNTECLSILEVGAGVGQNVEVLKLFGTVDVLEIDPVGLERLRALAGVHDVFAGTVPCELPRFYDVIGAFDVIEHIEDDRKAVLWILERLKPGGIFVATVPAFQWLFSDHDRVLGHHRRYSAAVFNALIPEQFKVVSASYFNSVLFPAAVLSRIAWLIRRQFVSNKTGKQPVPHGGKLDILLHKLFQADVAAMRPDSRRRFGLSYYVCVKRVF